MIICIHTLYIYNLRICMLQPYVISTMLTLRVENLRSFNDYCSTLASRAIVACSLHGIHIEGPCGGDVATKINIRLSSPFGMPCMVNNCA
jgi:hypothetical protein